MGVKRRSQNSRRRVVLRMLLCILMAHFAKADEVGIDQPGQFVPPEAWAARSLKPPDSSGENPDALKFDFRKGKFDFTCLAAQHKMEVDNPQISKDEMRAQFAATEEPSSLKILRLGEKIISEKISLEQKTQKIISEVHKLEVACARGILAVSHNMSPTPFDKSACAHIGNSPQDANGLKALCLDLVSKYGTKAKSALRQAPKWEKLPELATLITDSSPDNLLLNLIYHPSSLALARQSLNGSQDQSELQKRKLASLNKSPAFQCLTAEAQMEVKCRAQYIFGKEAGELGLMLNSLYTALPLNADPKAVIETVFANINPLIEILNGRLKQQNQ